MTAPTPLRVAYVCADPGIPAFGTKGASVHVQEIIRAWRGRGADVRLYTSRVGDHVPTDLADVPVVHVPVTTGRGAGTADRERAQRRAAAELAARVVQDGADVVYERYSLFSDVLARIRTSLGVPAVLEVNAPLITEQATYRELVDAAGAQEVLTTQLRAADTVACVSAPVADWVRAQDRSAAGKVMVAPNGVNTDRIQPVRPDPGTPTVLFVGTLKPWHGTEVLLQAAALATRPWQVRIIGDGPQRPALTDQGHRLGLDVDFRGALAPDQVPAAMAGAMVAVAPYPRDTGQNYFSPLKIYEYAAAGLPVVASRTGQVPDIVLHGRTGLLVPPSDPRALAEAIDALVADPARAAELGAAGRDLMVGEHSWGAVLDRILAAGTTPAGSAA